MGPGAKRSQAAVSQRVDNFLSEFLFESAVRRGGGPLPRGSEPRPTPGVPPATPPGRGLDRPLPGPRSAHSTRRVKGPSIQEGLHCPRVSPYPRKHGVKQVKTKQTNDAVIGPKSCHSGRGKALGPLLGASNPALRAAGLVPAKCCARPRADRRDRAAFLPAWPPCSKRSPIHSSVTAHEALRLAGCRRPLGTQSQLGHPLAPGADMPPHATGRPGAKPTAVSLCKDPTEQ